MTHERPRLRKLPTITVDYHGASTGATATGGTTGSSTGGTKSGANG